MKSYLKNTKGNKLPNLKKDVLMGCFGNARRKLHEFMQKRTDDEMDKRLATNNWPAVLGSDDFVMSMKKKYGITQKDNIDYPQARAWVGENIPIQTIIDILKDKEPDAENI